MKTVDKVALRGLTLHRPWAWAMTHGKAIENRGWPPPGWLVGHYFALHAGKKWDYDGAEFVRRILPDMPREGGEHPEGVIVGVAKLVSVIGREKPGGPIYVIGDPTPPIGIDMRWFFGPFGWVLADITEITPVECRGAQGLWFVPESVVALVRERWREAKKAA
jgi:hypothetical protein